MCLILSSCLTIIHPLVTATNVITDSRIDGAWNNTVNKEMQIRQVSKSKYLAELESLELKEEEFRFYSKLYTISFHENGIDYLWLAGLTKICNQYYINLKPDEALNKSGKEVYRYDKDYFVSGSIAKLELKNENAMTVRFLNGDYIKKNILAGKVHIDYEYDPLFGTFVITSSQEDLVKFLEKYGNNDNLYNGGKIIELERRF
jgi:hypothetical protein